MKRKLQMKRKLTDEEDEATDDQHLFTPQPAKRSHKPVVKTGTTLQLTPDFTSVAAESTEIWHYANCICFINGGSHRRPGRRYKRGQIYSQNIGKNLYMF